MKINSVIANEVLDSRGNPTIEAGVILEDNTIGWAAVPSGASTGIHEALELRDHDPKRYNGLGVLHAVENITTKIAGALKGLKAEDQQRVDQVMIDLDGSENKSNLGANAILAVSLATARAAAMSQKQPLYTYLTKFNPNFNGTYTMPIPQMNLLNGGKHGDWATDFQEFMVLPIGAKSIAEAIRMGAETYFHLKKVLKVHGYSIGLGDEGGFAPNVSSNEEPFALLTEAVTNAGYIPGKDITFGIDAASSEFFENGKYVLKKEGKELTSNELGEYYKQLAKQYPTISAEDIFAEDDWEGWNAFTQSQRDHMQIVGDDLYATNVKRLQRGIKEKSTNAILIKVNQIGTLTETVNAILLARKHTMASIVSHRSGETEDTFIADFVVAMGTGQIKTGSLARSERVAKYNRLMRIERELKEKATYATFPQNA